MLCYLYTCYVTCTCGISPVHVLYYLYMWYFTCTRAMLPVHVVFHLYMCYVTCTCGISPVHMLCYLYTWHSTSNLTTNPHRRGTGYEHHPSLPEGMGLTHPINLGIWVYISLEGKTKTKNFPNKQPENEKTNFYLLGFSTPRGLSTARVLSFLVSSSFERLFLHYS